MPILTVVAIVNKINYVMLRRCKKSYCFDGCRIIVLEFSAELMAKAGNVFEGVDVVGSTPPQFWNKDHYLAP